MCLLKAGYGMGGADTHSRAVHGGALHQTHRSNMPSSQTRYLRNLLCNLQGRATAPVVEVVMEAEEDEEGLIAVHDPGGIRLEGLLVGLRGRLLWRDHCIVSTALGLDGCTAVLLRLVGQIQKSRSRAVARGQGLAAAVGVAGGVVVRVQNAAQVAGGRHLDLLCILALLLLVQVRVHGLCVHWIAILRGLQEGKQHAHQHLKACLVPDSKTRWSARSKA